MGRQMVGPSLLLLLFSLVGGRLEEGWRVVRQRGCQDEEEYMCRQLAPSGSDMVSTVQVWGAMFRLLIRSAAFCESVVTYSVQCPAFHFRSLREFCPQNPSLIPFVYKQFY